MLGVCHDYASSEDSILSNRARSLSDKSDRVLPCHPIVTP